MAFGVRRTSEPIPADTDFYACPLCAYTTTKENEMIAHLVDVHGMKKKDAKALIESTSVNY